MGKIYESIDTKLEEFISAQQLFFVATSPLSDDGLVNVSPKGLDCFRILGPRQVAYLDVSGSGIETVAHLKENGRITIMFCSFVDPPMILRLYGKGTAIEHHHPEFSELIGNFEALPGTRAIIKVDVERIADSCGWGVPRMAFESHRDQLPRYTKTIGDEGLRKAQLKKNMTSLDGLPGLEKPSV